MSTAPPTPTSVPVSTLRGDPVCTPTRDDLTEGLTPSSPGESAAGAPSAVPGRARDRGSQTRRASIDSLGGTDRAPTTPPPETTFAPGARVVIRDAEWVVRSVDPSAAGGQQLLCVGVWELVREREAIFLTKLERQIEVLDPAKTTLVPDRSPRFADSIRAG